MKRSPIKRGTAKLARKTPVRRSNPERRAAQHHRNFDGGMEHDHFIRRQPCCLCRAAHRRQVTKTQAAHARARGMGGAKGDYRSLVPLCWACHREQEAIGNKRIAAIYGVDLEAVAREMLQRHLDEIAAVPAT